MNKFPSLITFDGSRLPALKELANRDGDLQKEFRKKAENLLSKGRISVVDRKLRAITGDPHDYMSMGPYWWPNPNTENGLPYIRRDGEVNPETKDPCTYSAMASAVYELSLAAYYFDDTRFSEKAVQMIRDWHIEPESFMKPHLEYGQSIPGICTGRGIGLIDFAGSYQLFNGIRILEFLGAIDEDTLAKTKAWYVDFINWMLTSETGVDEDNQHNNHGAWFDVQVAAAALFTDRPILAKKTLMTAYDRRVVKHIMPDGSQPHELARTHAIGYSSMNLNALFLLGNMARLTGVKAPYWEFTDAQKPLIVKATEYLHYYCVHFDEFKYQEIGGRPSLVDATMHISRMNALFPSAEYEKAISEAINDTMIWRLKPLI
jgi:hypothetical protein